MADPTTDSIARFPVGRHTLGDVTDAAELVLVGDQCVVRAAYFTHRCCQERTRAFYNACRQCIDGSSSRLPLSRLCALAHPGPDILVTVDQMASFCHDYEARQRLAEGRATAVSHEVIHLAAMPNRDQYFVAGGRPSFNLRINCQAGRLVAVSWPDVTGETLETAFINPGGKAVLVYELERAAAGLVSPPVVKRGLVSAYARDGVVIVHDDKHGCRISRASAGCLADWLHNLGRDGAWPGSNGRPWR